MSLNRPITPTSSRVARDRRPVAGAAGPIAVAALAAGHVVPAGHVRALPRRPVDACGGVPHDPGRIHARVVRGEHGRIVLEAGKHDGRHRGLIGRALEHGRRLVRTDFRIWATVDRATRDAIEEVLLLDREPVRRRRGGRRIGGRGHDRRDRRRAATGGERGDEEQRGECEALHRDSGQSGCGKAPRDCMDVRDVPSGLRQMSTTARRNVRKRFPAVARFRRCPTPAWRATRATRRGRADSGRIARGVADARPRPAGSRRGGTPGSPPPSTGPEAGAGASGPARPA